MQQGLIIVVILTGLFSFSEKKVRMREGYYFSSHGHANGLLKIKSNKIEYYADNIAKSWGYGKYELNEVDSVIKVSYERIWKSKREDSHFTFEKVYKIRWNKERDAFELSEYEYRKKTDAIENLKKRVKASSEIKVDREETNLCSGSIRIVSSFTAKYRLWT